MAAEEINLTSGQDKEEDRSKCNTFKGGRMGVNLKGQLNGSGQKIKNRRLPVGGTTPNRHHCPLCRRKFSSWSSLSAHKKLAHSRRPKIKLAKKTGGRQKSKATIFQKAGKVTTKFVVEESGSKSAPPAVTLLTTIGGKVLPPLVFRTPVIIVPRGEVTSYLNFKENGGTPPKVKPRAGRYSLPARVNLVKDAEMMSKIDLTVPKVVVKRMKPAESEEKEPEIVPATSVSSVKITLEVVVPPITAGDKVEEKEETGQEVIDTNNAPTISDKELEQICTAAPESPVHILVTVFKPAIQRLAQKESTPPPPLLPNSLQVPSVSSSSPYGPPPVLSPAHGAPPPQPRNFLPSTPFPPMPPAFHTLEPMFRQLHKAHWDKVAARQKYFDPSFFLHMNRYQPEDTPPTPSTSKRFQRGEVCPPPPEVTYACATCGKAFTTKLGLGSHQRYHKLEHQTRHRCDHCQLPFPNKRELANHVTSAHSNPDKKNISASDIAPEAGPSQ